MSYRSRRLIIKIAILILLLGILGYLLFSITMQYHVLRQEGDFNLQQLRTLRYLKRPHQLPAGTNISETVDAIQPWMTFSYLNLVFGMPSNYLQSKLHITDPAYPRIAIQHAISRQSLPATIFMENLKTAVREYLAATETK